MKTKSSLKNALTRGKGTILVRRRGRLFAINKANSKIKYRQS